MRRPALVVIATATIAVALFAGAGAGTASAQPSPYGVGDERATPAPAETHPRNTGAAPEAVPWAKPPEDGSAMRAPQMLDSRPSGFWTSNRPARGGAYRWRIMAAGGLVLAVTMFFVLRLLIRTSRDRQPARAIVHR
ncbi:MAG TPA: hypothetical protein VM261_10240 [Kofleriaceae bacterium]|nr:hypothetical protein [Kofleriaceae bacterium]